jgi:glycosyltransferase involved in cell wall biosynthesis
VPKINILYIITKLELGGAQKQLLSLIRNLNKDKFNIFLFTARDGLLMDDALAIAGLTVERAHFLERRLNLLKDMLAIVEIYRFIKKNRIDIVHSHSSKAGVIGRLASWLAKVKIIIHTVHGWSFNDYQPCLVRGSIVWLERLLALCTQRLVVVSQYDLAKGRQNHIGNHDRYQLIRYGIDFNEFNLKDADIRKELGINPQDLVIGTVACLKPQKSPEDFLRLCLSINQAKDSPKRGGEVKFILVGDGVLRPQIERLIDKHNLRGSLILTGWRRDIPRILSGMDIFVLTSLWEGLPIAVLEAMAAGLPVVATDTGAVAEVVINGKTGFLTGRRDVRCLAEKLLIILRDDHLRKQMRQNAENSLSCDFSVANMVQATQLLYRIPA